MMLSLDTAYRSFGGEVEASSTPTICRLSDSPRHQLSAIAHARCRRASPTHRLGNWPGTCASRPTASMSRTNCLLDDPDPKYPTSCRKQCFRVPRKPEKQQPKIKRQKLA